MAITGLKQYQKLFVDEFKRLTHRYNGWQVWEDFVVMSSCAISNRIDSRNYGKREALYMSRIGRYDKKDAETFPKLLAFTVEALDDNPEQDFLGELFMMLELSNHWKGQFFTPYHLCRSMAELQNDGIENKIADKGFISVNDCACGAGALLIAFANMCQSKGINYQNHVLFVAQDIDMTAAMMCYIQLSLLGCPGYVVVADTLRYPTIGPETDVWYTPFYCSDVWHTRRTLKRLDALVKVMPPPKPRTQVVLEQPEQLTLF